MVLVPVTCLGWAVLTLILLLLGGPPFATLLPLMVLVGGFEAVHALHVGAERIGRYLQVYYEADPNGPRWETTAMTVGPALPGGGIDPLFSVVFVGATLINLVPALLPQPTPAELGVIVSSRDFCVRVVRALRAARSTERGGTRKLQSVQSRERAPPDSTIETSQVSVDATPPWRRHIQSCRHRRRAIHFAPNSANFVRVSSLTPAPHVELSVRICCEVLGVVNEFWYGSGIRP